MWEFILSLGQWVSENWKTIFATLTSGSFITGVCAIWSLRKQNNSVKANTDSTNELNESLKSNENVKKSIDDNTIAIKGLENEVKEYTSDLQSLRDDYALVKAEFEKVSSKLSSVLEVMSIVYSTLKDETIRTAVNNIIINAKYSETATRVELEKQVEELKLKVEEDTELLKAKVNEKVEQVKTIVNPTKTTETPTRY